VAEAPSRLWLIASVAQHQRCAAQVRAPP